MTDDDRTRDDQPLDAGAYIGREPELADETIPGGVRPDDDRVAATQSQGTGVGRPDVRGQPADQPSGHREASATEPSDADAAEPG